MRQKKLVLKKTTIADLNQRQMGNIFGGREALPDSNPCVSPDTLDCTNNMHCPITSTATMYDTCTVCQIVVNPKTIIDK
jgi:hypothetical protein